MTTSNRYEQMGRPEWLTTRHGQEFTTKRDYTNSYPYISTSNHTGHAVLVTGASRGIGRATAISFARAGASSIAIAARGPLGDVESAILSAAKEAGHVHVPQILKLNLDVTDAKAVQNAAAKVESAFGRLDILVNNAGRLEHFQSATDIQPDDWWLTWEINIKGVFLVTRALLPLLLKSQDGLKTILNVSSCGAMLVTPGLSAYQSTKFALLRLTEFIGAEYGAQGILAFAIHPGSVRTYMAGVFPDEMQGIFLDEPELTGDSISWLTEERREWLAGRYVSVNWDMEELVARKEEIVDGDKLKMRMVV